MAEEQAAEVVINAAGGSGGHNVYALGGGAAVVVAGLGYVIYRRYFSHIDIFATSNVALIIVIYSLCSSSLLIINKVCVTFIPTPSFILLLQLTTSAVAVWALSSAGIVSTEKMEMAKAKKYMLVVACFAGFLYCNVKALQYVPVDTIIVARSSIPLIVAVMEYLLKWRELPTMRSWAALIGVLAGAAMYAHHDINFSAIGYFWVACWYALCMVDALLMKQVADTVPMTTWSRTLYNNAMAAPVIMMIAVGSNEYSVLRTSYVSTPAVLALSAGCVMGLAMNYFSWRLRELVSATSVTVIGNVCKFLTILINIVVWNKHSDLKGTLALLFCMVMALIYQEAPKRKGAVTASEASTPLLPKDPQSTPTKV